MQELMNILWAFVQFRYRAKQLLPKLEEAVRQPDQAAQLTGSDWASLAWGFASLGEILTPPAATMINEHGATCLEAMKPVELCNLLW